MAKLETATETATESATVAGGCFWGVEDLLRKVPGIVDTEVGYAGGETEHPTYETVKTGRTSYAEAVRIDYDPALISYTKVLELFFQLHDPTTLNRSAIFVYTPEEKAAAHRVIAAENASGRHPRAVTTTVEEAKPFYSAEDYHQDYLLKNPGGYTCHYWRGPGPQ